MPVDNEPLGSTHRIWGEDDVASKPEKVHSKDINIS